ncbi:DUF938 domain-containing protein [Xanthobacter dioxanivorans]|uniref:DUF938 domain-containing protein n=1 Tax=Xanthobacter dioxanivorans TaxID=2528964 RepID=UPI001E55A671|nr:DUF938 domain-containing protein [Xanthobacter dioxanivorans]
MSSAPSDARRSAPAVARNRGPIGDLLLPLLPPSGVVLEIASGTGEHAVHFARRLPHLTWQPSDPSPQARESIAAWLASERLPNLRPPLALDAAAGDWPVGPVDAIVCVNMLHISPWEATQGLMHGAGRRLPPGGLLFIYGAFRQTGVPTAASNEAFDQDLKRNDSRWGLRHLADVEACAAGQGLTLVRVEQMPANNLSLIFRKGMTVSPDTGAVP